ncbi:MAG TPA: DNA polymerase III subunit delta' C-terminal domain-containing protein, partial [bacterium]|nr:DNA polymerase III subunit delta' C-terminal domain-containing protein [bacterium]
DGQFIKIDQVRQVIESLALIPLLARRRVVVLARAECLHLESANALLKMLEEPPADSLLVLCASQPERLPDTIRSRCMPVHFAPLAQAVLRALFAQPAGGKGAQAAALHGPALDFAVRFAQGRLRPVLRAKAGEWLAWRTDLVRALQELQQGPSLTLEERLPLWSQPEGLDFVLEWLESWFRDLALLGAGAVPQALINADQAEALQALLPGYPPARAARCQAAVLATRQALTLNANRSLALEALWYSFKLGDAA